MCSTDWGEVPTTKNQWEKRKTFEKEKKRVRSKQEIVKCQRVRRERRREAAKKERQRSVKNS